MSKAGSGGRGQWAGKNCNLYSTGFTLIEVMLAISILAFVVATIYMSFSTTSKNVEQAETLRDNTDLARTLVVKMTDDIHNAYCVSLTNGKTFIYGKKQELNVSTKKRQDSIYLTTLTNWRRANSKEMDLWEVGYYFKDKPDGNGTTLMRHEKRELSNDVPPLEGGIEYEITDKVAELHLRYMSGTTWAEEWGGTGQCSYPREVEISLVLENGSFFTTRVDMGNAR
jgi:type II secretion system protein J